MVSGDRLAYSDSGSSDDLLIYDIGSDDSPLEPSLPWDKWQLTPDGLFILYSQGRSIHLYSLEFKRVTYSSPFEGRWTSISETNAGLVFANAFGELFLWHPPSGPPWQLSAPPDRNERAVPDLQWVRCCASLKTPYCCVFGQPRRTIEVFNTAEFKSGQQKPVMSVDGIGAQIGCIKSRTGQEKPVIAILDRRPDGLKLHMRYLEFSDPSGPDVFEPQHIPFPDGYNPNLPSQALSCVLLLAERLSCIVVLLSLSQSSTLRNPTARARIHDALDGSMIMQEDVDVDLSEIRMDGKGRILKRASDETIERLSVSEERLRFHREQQARAMAQAY
ncbi:hypothetical protein M407DRAFT_115388 [Tulasnella calospora MUT 4182]|uniref:Uncharacterized protein n=1 Tax=Tulasnella calospora MUT 4182 TaxID=1051891 RepID=A0A0C3LDU5_9AGAM|nr:hypothetical protein M407DRAFT_115388 [Tulasnella calospora MUT 4182]